MDILLRERKTGFLSFLKRKKRINVTYRRTIGKVFGVGGGYKTDISTDEELAEEGRVKDLIDLLTRGNSNEPFNMPSHSLRGYELIINGTARELRANKELVEELLREVPSERRDSLDKYISSFVGWFCLEIGEDGIRKFNTSEPAVLYKPLFHFLQR